MTQTLEFTFEDAPLYTVGKYETGFVSGTAEVAYQDDGDWTVAGISILLESGRDTIRVFLDPRNDSVLWSAILKSRYDAFDDAVAEALACDGIALPDFNAEHRLSARQLGLNTKTIPITVDGRPFLHAAE